MHLIRAAYDACRPDGALVAIEALIDDARRENVQGLLMSLNMLIEFGDAFDYTGADFRKWCGEVGFKRFEVIHLAGPSSARWLTNEGSQHSNENLLDNFASNIGQAIVAAIVK
jgi:hypothetical protein